MKTSAKIFDFLYSAGVALAAVAAVVVLSAVVISVVIVLSLTL